MRTKLTSAQANKNLKQLTEEREYWLNKEKNSSIYTSGINEEPVVPEYDYLEVANQIQEIEEKIMLIKHAINLANATSLLAVGEKSYTVDQVLIRMAQLNSRKRILDNMRKQLPKSRVIPSGYSARSAMPEYQYANYDIELIKKEYEKISREIADMQMALDFYNQTVQFEVNF